MQEHTARVLERRTLTPVVRHVVLRLESPGEFSFQPGQFIQFVLDRHTLRIFSIASSPTGLPLLELCADVSPGGRGSQFIEGLRPGQAVTFRGPFGMFTVPPTNTRPLEFVATGAGIAPIRAMIHELFQAGGGRPVVLTFGNRTAADILYHDEWQKLAQRVPSFRYLPALSQPEETWSGARGRVTDLLPSRRTELSGRAFYLCGSPQMVDATRQVLRSLGVPEDDVHFEKFF